MQPIAGVSLKITDTDGNTVEMWDKTKKEWVDAEWTSAATPQKIFGLKTGTTYKLVEVAPPAGYKKAAATEFKLKKDGTIDTASTTTPMNDGVLLVEDKPIVDVEVKKAWDDEDDKFGIRPKSVTVKLLADGNYTGKTLVLKEDASDPTKSWTGKFEGLDMCKYDEGTKAWIPIDYTVDEVNVPDGYVRTVTVTEDIQKPGDTKKIKIKNSLDLGDLDIKKNLDNFYLGDGDKIKSTVFAFRVEGFFGTDDQGKDKKIFETMIGIKFDGKVSKTETLKDLPVGTKIVVTEVYSGVAYQGETVSKNTRIVKAGPGEDPAKVEFSNKYNDNHEQSGITNRFEKDKNDGSYNVKGNKSKSSIDN